MELPAVVEVAVRLMRTLQSARREKMKKPPLKEAFWFQTNID
jgi:hypothetical protein